MEISIGGVIVDTIEVIVRTSCYLESFRLFGIASETPKFASVLPAIIIDPHVLVGSQSDRSGCFRPPKVRFASQ